MNNEIIQSSELAKTYVDLVFMRYQIDVVSRE